MCRQYSISCQYCGRSSQVKANIIVNCENIHLSIWPAAPDNSNIIFEANSPCEEIQETRGIFSGIPCHQCYSQDGGPSLDPEDVATGKKTINTLIETNSILLHLIPGGPTHTQAMIRVEGERRKELDKIQAAVDAYRTSLYIDGGEAGRVTTLRLFRLLRSIYIFNLVVDADHKFHVHGDKTSLPPLLQEHDLTDLTDKDCTICAEEMGKMTPESTLENPVRVTQCGHIFGNLCILTWLNETNKPTCPMCRETFSTQTHRFPDGYNHKKAYDDEEEEYGFESEEEEDDDGFPDDWLEILKEAASSPSATDSREALNSETGISRLSPVHRSSAQSYVPINLSLPSSIREGDF